VDLTYVDSKSLKTLEDYAQSLLEGILSLKTLESFHIKAVEIGILPDDLSCRANTIIWDLRRDIKLYMEQLSSVLELVPDDFNEHSMIDKLKKREITLARKLTKKTKVEK